MIQRVSGQKDAIIRLLRELQTEDGRRRNNRYFIEEREIIRRAFDFGGAVESLIITDRYQPSPEADELMERAAYARVEVYGSTEGLISKVLDARPIPDCMAIVERRVVPLSGIFEGERPLVVMVEDCENADNLGMLLRSTDAAGVTGVVLAAGTTDPFSRRVVRGSRGAVFTVPLSIHPDSARIIDEARKSGLRVIATSANSESDYSRVDLTKPTMIVVGNEHTGISGVVREMADSVVRIPMHGKINSLNIAVAASIVMYEAARQRG